MTSFFVIVNLVILTCNGFNVIEKDRDVVDIEVTREHLSLIWMLRISSVLNLAIEQQWTSFDD